MGLFDANPYDFGSAASGPSPAAVSAYHASVNAWRNHRDTAITPAISQLDQAIGAFKAWAPIIEQIVATIQANMPLSGGTSPQAEGRLQELQARINDINQVVGMLQNARGLVPSIGRVLNTLTT